MFLHSAHMPWLANTFWQLLLSLDLFCCRHCWTALSLPSSCRQKRDASRLQACCSCGVPMWLWASEDEMPDSSMRMATTYRMTISLGHTAETAPRVSQVRAVYNRRAVQPTYRLSLHDPASASHAIAGLPPCLSG